MRQILITLFALIISTSAQANDISVKFDEIAAGSTVTIRNSDGRVFTHLHTGQISPGVYGLDAYEGRSARGQPILTSEVDRDGNLLNRVSLSSGLTAEWRPHRCMRVVGRCSYVEIFPGEPAKRFTRINQVTADGFAYQVTDASGTIVLSGQTQLDPMGWPTAGAFQTDKSGVIQLRMLSSDYR